MSDLDQANGGLGIAFILTEMRDLRKGMESRDNRLSGSIEAVRTDLNSLSKAVVQSQDHVTSVQRTVSSLAEDVKGVRDDVDDLISDKNQQNARKESAWSGPVTLMKALALAGAGIGGFVALVHFFGPTILALIAAIP